MTTAGRAVLAAVLAAVALAACSGSPSSSEPTEVAQELDATQRYCSLSAELDAQDGPPSEEQLAEIARLAPPEVAEEVATLVEAVRTEDFGNPEVQEAESTLLAWEAEHCVESLEGQPTEAGT